MAVRQLEPDHIKDIVGASGVFYVTEPTEPDEADPEETGMTITATWEQLNALLAPTVHLNNALRVIIDKCTAGADLESIRKLAEGVLQEVEDVASEAAAAKEAAIPGMR